MSATGRGAVRNEHDFYATPEDAFKPLLPTLRSVQADWFWEPACGDGRLCRWMNEAHLQARGNDLIAGYDFLQDEADYPCIITNPPFSLAFEFCQHAVNHAGHVFLLLRLNFLASGRRRSWFVEHEPDALFILSDRPGFVMACRCGLNKRHRWTLPIGSQRPKQCPECGHGKVIVSTSDACEYAWYYWGRSHRGIHHL